IVPRHNLLRGTGPSAVSARATHCIRGHRLPDVARLSVKTGKAVRFCQACSDDAYLKRIPAERHAALIERRKRGAGRHDPLKSRRARLIVPAGERSKLLD